MQNLHAPKRIRRLLKSLLDQTLEPGLILLDPQGCVITWTTGSEHLFGYRADEMLGQTLARLFTPEDIELGIPQHELDVATSNGQAEDDRWQLRKDGARIWVSGVLLPIHNGGEIAGF